jgi:hypothetical protein
MTDAELSLALRRLKVETGSLACLGCGHEHNCSTHGCTIIRAAEERINELHDVKSELQKVKSEPQEVKSELQKVKSECKKGKCVEMAERIEGPTRNDPVNHPAHYTAGGIECIDAIAAALASHTDPMDAWLTGQVIKYLWRWPMKNGVEDLRKARFYLDRLLERVHPQGKEAAKNNDET